MTAGRCSTPDGKRAYLAAKVSEPVFESVLARCAGLGVTRSAYIGALIAADLGAAQGARLAAPGITVTPDGRMPPGTAAVVPAPARRPKAAPKPPCKHLGVQRGGFCRECSSYT
ncbi:MAG TPA: hypothetical protein VK586_09035 [Streptosporangiaceae bacterium]|nr:hypothetical protein [Streptosporangiaceae bacterium]